MDELYIEASRKAHELEATHGFTALAYAERMLAKAVVDGEAEAEDFWRAVAASLRPREVSS